MPSDRYVLERELGRGGMATSTSPGREHRREVALKVLRPELAAVLAPSDFSRDPISAGSTIPTSSP